MPLKYSATLLLSAVLGLSACSTMIRVPLDSTPLSETKATAIFFWDYGANDKFTIFVDQVPVGTVTTEIPLKVAIDPGVHQLNTGSKLAIDRIYNQQFEVGKTYFFQIKFDAGYFYPGGAVIQIALVEPRESYTARSFRQ